LCDLGTTVGKYERWRYQLNTKDISGGVLYVPVFFFQFGFRLVSQEVRSIVTATGID